MNRIAKRVLAGAAALGLTAIGAPAAHATVGAIHGGCFLLAAQAGSATSNVAEGVIGDVSVTQDSTGVPTAAQVTCWVQVDGVIDPDTQFTYSGTGVQSGVNPIEFTASESDVVQLCEQVVAGTTSTTNCQFVTVNAVPPRPVRDTLNSILDVTDPFFLDWIQPVICPVLGELSGSYGVVTIGPDGDVSVTDPPGSLPRPLYDCPPYDPEPSDGQPVELYVAAFA